MFWWSLIVVVLSFCIHLIIDRIINSSEHTFRNIPLWTKPVNRRSFVWRNTIISLIHAIVTGTWAIIAFYLEPTISVDLISFNSKFTISLVAYSVGYFIFDSVHMIKYSRDRSTVEFLCHHLIVFLCFSSALVSEKYIGYAVVSLLVEVNSVFLHIRRLLNYTGISKRSPLFMWICFLNIGTFVIFRFVVLCWMTRWLVINRDSIPLIFYCLGAIGLASLMVMNITLFIRIVYADVLTNSSAAEAASLVASAGSSTGAARKSRNLLVLSPEEVTIKSS